MADIKTIIIQLNGSINSPELTPLKEKAVQFDQYTSGDTKVKQLEKVEMLDNSTLSNLAQVFEFHPVVIETSEEFLRNSVQAVLECKNRHTLVVVIATDGLLFSGAGITREHNSSHRPAKAADIVPTICYLTGLPVPPDSTGSLLYQVMKDVNAPFSQIVSMKASIEALEYTIERSKRQAWDKHDCA